MINRALYLPTYTVDIFEIGEFSVVYYGLPLHKLGARSPAGSMMIVFPIGRGDDQDHGYVIFPYYGFKTMNEKEGVISFDMSGSAK